MDSPTLAAHLEAHYGIDVERVIEIESVHRVDRRDGPSWIARSFPVERPVAAVEGDAEILRHLEAQGYPAERCAHDEAVSVVDGHAVLVTLLVAGKNGRPDQSAALHRTMGDLLGRLQTLPEATGAMARPAGSWHHLSLAGGGRHEDVIRLEPSLADDRFAPLRDELAGIDVLEGLPEALLHPDFATANAMLTPDGPVLIDWTGAGRGARIAALGFALSAGASNLGLVDAVMAGYRPHVTLEPEELDRLPGAVRAFGLVLDCWMGIHHPAHLPHVIAGLPARRAQAEVVAARARAAFAGA